MARLIGADLIGRGVGSGFANASLAAVRDAIATQLERLGGEKWLERVADELPAPLAPLVEELAVAPLPAHAESEADLTVDARSLVAAIIDRHLLHEKATLVRQLQRVQQSGDPARVRELRVRLVGLETERRALQTA